MIFLLTRPLKQSLNTQKYIQEIGHQSIIDPLLEVEFISQNLPSNFDSWDYLVLTSPQPLEILSADITLPIWCIGKTTGTLVKKSGLNLQHAIDGDVTELIKFILENALPGKRFLCLSALEPTTDLSKIFKDAPFKIDQIPIYHTRQSQSFSSSTIKHFSQKKIDYVLLSSTKSAFTFLDHIKKLSFNIDFTTISMGCLSEKIKNVVECHNWKRVIVSNELSYTTLINQCIHE